MRQKNLNFLLGQGFQLELTVAKADIAKVVGKHGRTADALRTLLSAVSGKTKKRTLLEIMD